MRSVALENSVRRVLRSNTLLGGISEADFERLAEQSRLSKCDRGELIWFDGSQTDFFGLVGAGFVKMVRSNSSGIEVTLEIMGPGQIFGLLGTVSGDGCPLSAYGLTKTQYLRIPKRVFTPIYEASTVIQQRLVKKVALQMHSKLDFMARLSTGRVEERIAAILFLLAESYGEKNGNAIRLTIPLTRQELGEMSGTTTETTIRTLSKWNKISMVTTEHQHITIADPNALELVLRN